MQGTFVRRRLLLGLAIDDTGPSRKEALLASLGTLKKYLQDLDGSFACKLEGMLSSFGHKTRLIESQNLTLISLELTSIHRYEPLQ